jgi:sugar lactone lactonase YvrE
MTEAVVLPVAPSALGESPFWHPAEAALYWCDIDGRRLNRFDPARGDHREWSFDSEPACVAPVLGGGLLVARRDGLWRFEPDSGRQRRLAKPPYDPAQQRFNDGKADPQGRFWVATLDDARRVGEASLYRLDDDGLERVAGGATVGNGLAFSPDGRTLLWADTSAHAIDAFDLEPADGSLSRRRPFARFTPKPAPGADGAGPPYGGRPDGAAMDSEGCVWVAMYEGGRLLRLSPEGDVVQAIDLPVRCPTMPCFGGPDLRTLYVTSARQGRPAAELLRHPGSGGVLQLRVPVPGLPVNFVDLG